MRAWVAILLVAVSGCLAGPADEPEPVRFLEWREAHLEPRFEIMAGESVWIEASTDGAMLHAVLWRPDAAEEPEWKAPVVLVDTPYKTIDGRDDLLDPAEPMHSDAYDWLIDELVPRGYAVAYKDVRGTNESGGCLEQTATTQRQDGYDAVEWFGTQDWSNGKVGMFGKSYLAETQYGAAVLDPPHLATIVPVASVSGQYEWNNYDGVPFTLQTLLGNAFYMVGSSVPPGTTLQGLQNYPGHYLCQPAMMAQGADFSGDWNAYWEERELRKLFADINASVLYVHGLQDWNVRQVAVRDSFEHIPSEKRLMLGQWHHDFPDLNRYRDDWSRTDWRDMVHAWYDHWLLGIDNGIMEALPPVQIQDSQGAWRAEHEYPPADAWDFTLHLAPDELTAERPDGWTLLLRENEEAFLREQGLPIPDADTPQPTELWFTSAPLQADVRTSGWPVLHFNATLFDGLYPDPDTVIDAHWAVDMYLDGDWLNAGYLSARHREGVENPQPVPEGEVLEYALRFHPQDTVLPAGSAISIRLAGSNDEVPVEGTFWGAELSGGRLVFPAIDRDLGDVSLDVPLTGQ